ncbi:MAG TPA: hypothetical protein VE344_06685 [Methylomirabilota bacterium]|nr:hypothetical protein [Methylomirabilota bacterium]
MKIQQIILAGIGAAVFFLLGFIVGSHRHELVEIPPKLSTTIVESNHSGSTVIAKLQADGQKHLREIAAGIYEIQISGHAPDEKEFDLRSDGTGVYSQFYQGHEFYAPKKIKWDVEQGGDDFVIIADGNKFKIEGSDLIDSDDNRWLHLR